MAVEIPKPSGRYLIEVKSVQKTGCCVDEVFGVAAFKSALDQLLLYPTWKALGAFIMALWGTFVTSATLSFHAALWGTVVLTVLDTSIAQWLAARQGTWTRQQSPRWMVKLTVYTAVWVAFWFVGFMIDATVRSPLTWGFAFATFALVVMATTEFLSLVENANTLMDGKLDRLVTLATTATRWLLRLTEPPVPTDDEEENPNG